SNSSAHLLHPSSVHAQSSSNIIKARDLLTKQADTKIKDWLMLNGDSSDEDDGLMVDAGGVEGIHLNDIESAVLPDNLTKTATDWLTADDKESHRILSDFLLPDNLTFNWDNDAMTLRGQRETFVGRAGPTFEMNGDVKAIDVFLNFFDEDLLDLIVFETNKYSTYIIDRDLTANSRLNFWKNGDRSEIAIFLAVLIIKD
ncbi:hypothetical protein evm_015627, partial [Chilo suppressalis]